MLSDVPRGVRIKLNQLVEKLAGLDIDEGVRIENVYGKKIFINRNSSATFVVQFNDSDDFRYMRSIKRAVKLVDLTFGKKGTVWIY
jgi:hypothetical protein